MARRRRTTRIRCDQVPRKRFRAIPRNPREDELAQRNSYLAAIGDLGGDEEAASRLWRQPSGDPEQIPDPQCLEAAKAFINHWDRRLKEACGATSGFYGPTVGAHVKEFWKPKLNYPPDDLWFSEVQQREGKGSFATNKEWQSVWKVPNNRPPENRLPADHRPNRRLHQWDTNLTYETFGTEDVTEIDLDCAMGVVAGSAKTDQHRNARRKSSLETGHAR
jgi:hypothetical protein